MRFGPASGDRMRGVSAVASRCRSRGRNAVRHERCGRTGSFARRQPGLIRWMQGGRGRLPTRRRRRRLASFKAQTVLSNVEEMCIAVRGVDGLGRERKAVS